jgi:pseudouridine-5'-phosphate glycosidase
MIRLSEAVADAVAEGRPVVALESTVFSSLGLPAPHNQAALQQCLDAVTSNGAVPAVTAVIDGVARVGIDEADHERILSATAKTASRELGVAVAQRWDVGVTTVSASLALAEAAGVAVFATGGIGGVHRGSELTGDVSADLAALARHQVVCVSAGAKAFLDLGRTLEMLDTLGVPVLGWQTDEFPAFYLRTSGLAVSRRIDSATEAAAALRASIGFGLPQGVLVTPPIPEADALDADRVWAVVEAAQRDADASGLRGAPVTPFVLERIAAATEGESIPANLALARHNAEVAAQIAVAWTALA